MSQKPTYPPLPPEDKGVISTCFTVDKAHLTIERPLNDADQAAIDELRQKLAAVHSELTAERMNVANLEVQIRESGDAAAIAELKAQAGRGEALPGQVDTAFARIAGYNEAGSASPPPIIVNNYQFKVDVAMPIDGEFSGTPQEFVDDVADKVQDVLELRVFPEASAALRGEINR